MSSLNTIQRTGNHRSPRLGGREGERAAGVRDEINPKKIAKKFIYFSTSSLHAIKCNRGTDPQDWEGRGRERAAGGSSQDKSQRNC